MEILKNDFKKFYNEKRDLILISEPIQKGMYNGCHLVLCFFPESYHQFVTWIYNPENNSCFLGCYHMEEAPARDCFLQRCHEHSTMPEKKDEV